MLGAAKAEQLRASNRIKRKLKRRVTMAPSVRQGWLREKAEGAPPSCRAPYRECGEKGIAPDAGGRPGPFLLLLLLYLSPESEQGVE